ncbi:hypothetical protein E2562_013661 [Oryza meyeriana var. granulata]|uniref:DUF1618 domain-containing protein n=1 Tax=Oryza meyeriana var. granulata TaxID=110450 RepID=A0A6G1BIP4_9ORYZ|nr:hypothetical protein E2562_013661 [Oryza meyeriana var. granulata]
MGILRHGGEEDDLAVAELDITTPSEPPRLRVLCAASCSQWEVKRPPIFAVNGGDLDQEKLMMNCDADTVVPFGRYLCWVDYCMGGVLLCDVFDENPKLLYLELPPKIPGLDRLRHGRSWSPTKVDGLIDEDVKPASGFTAAPWILRIGETDEMTWVKETVVQSDELWVLDGFETLLRTPLQYPLVSLDAPNVVYFVLRQEGKKDVGVRL